MSSSIARAGIVIAALAAAIALFVVLAGGDDNGAESGAQPQSARERSERPAPSGAQDATRERSPEPQAPTLERIVVRGGKPVGGVRRLDYQSGDRVRFSVRSDIADEVHVHGYDIKKNVTAGGSVRFGFPAALEGVFEVELEHRHLPIAELRVEP